MRFLHLLSATFLPAAAIAQDTGSTILDPITIYGGLTPIETRAYGRANTVLTAEDMKARGITSVQDALRGLPGIAVSSTGAANTQLRIRGAEGNHTLVLVDGVRAAAGDSEYFLSGLETANIERIEILRGPQSVFFGADASAGVINIVTRKGTSGQEASGQIETGNGQAASVFLSTRNDRGGLSFSAAMRDDDGYDLSDTSGGDDDGIRRHTLNLSGDYRLTEMLRAGFRLRDADEEYGYDTTSWSALTAGDYVIDSNDTATRDETAGQIWLEAETLSGRLIHHLSYDQTRFETAHNDQDASKARTDLWKYRAVWGIDGTVDAASQTIAFGLERRKDEDSVATYQHRRSSSAIVEYRGAFDSGLDVQLGLRFDDNDVFRNATTWSLGLSYSLPNAPLRIHASAGTGVVNPDYSELFGGWGSIGNPDLEPEKNRGLDLGVEAILMNGRTVVDLTYFHENLENEITWSGIPLSNGTNYYNQSGTSKRQGIEFSGRFQASDVLTLGASYTYLDAKNPDGTVETRRPRHILGLNAEYLFAEGRGSFAGDLYHVAGNYDTQYFGSYATEELPDYTIVNIAAGYDLTDKVRLTGRVSNLFDNDHADVWGYRAQGRTGWLGLEAKW
ncbi:MAG: TonB-dependent receptor plug domain-containing protein [Paracoccus sp. (in: a-proteobacteria)]